MSKTRERIVGEKIYPLVGFKELVKNFFGNGEEYYKDDEIEIEVNKIIEQENSDFIRNLEKSTTSTGKKSGGKKNDRLNVKTTKKEPTARHLEDRERDEER